MNYCIRRVINNTKPGIDWEHPFWAMAETLEIAQFRPEGSEHRPRTRARLLYDADGIHGIFQVEDRYVLSKRTEYMDPVYRDSCVEFFVRPKQRVGYFNFEFNCGGAMLATQVINPERAPDGNLKEAKRFPAEIWKLVEIESTMPRTLPVEIKEPVTWRLRFYIPFRVMEYFVGPLGKVEGQGWRANFQKCAEENSHPHWASWAPLDRFDFHRVDCFGTIRFVL